MYVLCNLSIYLLCLTILELVFIEKNVSSLNKSFELERVIGCIR